jgi:5'(3')-deoxyribonucleotidase
MRRLRFLCDVDEVLVDFQTPALAVMEEVTGIRREPSSFNAWDIFTVLSPEERAKVFQVIEQPGFCASLKPLPRAIEGIRKIREFCDIFAVTSPFHSPTWVAERTEYLHRVFGFESHEVVHTASKHLVIGDALLDDKPSHIQGWAEAHPGGLPMLWDIPNTKGMGLDGLRVQS